ncbi:glycosyltransferase [Aquibium sp. ELW1220]|uniref:glycosyltransferase n=1 Tax=Aquibium sp. ELW1220 TaxID=2976766 RepID=UPI0025B11651|nr:glycosyltransferase [Aquibium sp. ELW1220]MDN2578976.1 glycosyltransferase [Aquibium sp. ELW1220]
MASLDIQASGPAYSIPALARGQARLGALVELHALGGSPIHAMERLDDRRHRNDLAGWTGLSTLGISCGMRAALRTGRFDILHTHGLWRMPNVYAAPGARLVIAPRGMLAPPALAFSPLRKRLFLKIAQGTALRAAEMFHATSEGEYDDIRRFGLKQPVAVIPNGVAVPPPEAVARVAEGRKTLLSLGRIHPVKGLDSLLEAWAKVEPVAPDWDLRIVGPDEGGHAAELAALKRRLGLKRVRIEPPVHGPARDTLMAAADLFVLSSRSENFAMTVAESLAVGVPVISSKGAPWSGLEANRCGWWVGHGPDALAPALMLALSLPDVERRAMGARGRAWMERDFSWARMAAMSLEAYGWLLGQGDRPEFVRVD